MKTIKDNWELFEELVVPKSAPPVQRTEMKKAFYSGALSLIGTQLGCISGDISPEDSVKQLNAIMKEAQQYVADLKAQVK